MGAPHRDGIKSKIGIWLAVLALVVLGGFAFYHFVGGSIDSAKFRVDGERVEAVAEGLNLKSEEGHNKQLIRGISGDGTFRGLALALADAKMLSGEQMQKLAGVSGREVNGAIDASTFGRENCVITGPATGADLILGLKEIRSGAIGEYGVLLTLRADNFDLCLDSEGKVPLIIGTKLHFLSLAELEDLCEKAGFPRPALVGKHAGELFGKYPFEHIVAE